ncbi:MAG: hypothetical protein EPO36_13240 [Chloroflexota bacterium]|nr:MAG: hypothetical protein EPO36_13240 [Chloroflexota bacterium]
MIERLDAATWSALEARLAGVESLLPEAPPWRPSEARTSAGSGSVRLGSAFGRSPRATTSRRRRLIQVLVVVGALIALVAGALYFGSPKPRQEPDARFGPLGLLRQSDSSATAALLPDGRTLIVSGEWEGIGTAVARADIWDPGSGLVSVDPPLVPRVNPTVTLLLDGRVLVSGGFGGPYQYSSSALASAELWDATASRFRETGSMASPRVGHTMTVLPDGRVLVVGGAGPAGGQAEAEIWDPATELFAPAGTLQSPRSGHAAALLPDGRVLVVGGGDPVEGTGVGVVEIWDPASRTFLEERVFLDDPRSVSIVRLPSGRVLIAGAFIVSGGYAGVSDWVEGSPGQPTTMSRQRDGHAATVLADGRILITGGRSASGVELASAEIWDAAEGMFEETKPLDRPAANHTAVLLPDGRVLIVLDGSGPEGVVPPFIYEPEGYATEATP